MDPAGLVGELGELAGEPGVAEGKHPHQPLASLLRDLEARGRPAGHVLDLTPERSDRRQERLAVCGRAACKESGLHPEVRKRPRGMEGRSTGAVGLARKAVAREVSEQRDHRQPVASARARAAARSGR